MSELSPHCITAFENEVENAAHILIQAMITPLPACDNSRRAQEHLQPVAGFTSHDKPSYRLPLLALDRNSRSQSPAVLAHTSKTTSKYAASSGVLNFPDQDSFEEWAIERLTASHPDVVIEKKRSARTTTISCRNRRNDAVGGTSCSWMQKATMKECDERPLRWVVSHEFLLHNAACVTRMNSRLSEKAAFTVAKAVSKVATLRTKEVSSQPQQIKKRRIEISDDSATAESGSETEEEEEETPAALRKRKAHHPGNALPSRARRYRW